MTRRTKQTYIHLMRYIEEHVCELNPDSFMTDYESGLRSALRLVYPHSNVRGCLFHYTQAIRKKSKSIPDFFKNLHRNAELESLYNQFLVLPLLPPEKVLTGFNGLKLEAQQNEAVFRIFLEYYERQWIQKVHKLYTYIYIT